MYGSFLDLLVNFDSCTAMISNFSSVVSCWSSKILFDIPFTFIWRIFKCVMFSLNLVEFLYLLDGFIGLERVGPGFVSLSPDRSKRNASQRRESWGQRRKNSHSCGFWMNIWVRLLCPDEWRIFHKGRVVCTRDWMTEHLPFENAETLQPKTLS